ncbi:MAG: RDD family protein [Akkermansiaceae bacterium]|nr:RDD family protein [Akkermansiaceae bacterium]
MQVWLIEGGEKRGPFESYEVRERIERKELTGEEKAWHDGCDEWRALRSLEVFRAEFEVPVVVPPPLPKKPRPFSRLWARWFDMQVYMALLFGGMFLLQLDMLAALRSTWFQLLHLLPYLIFDALMVHLAGTTPGKALLGLTVRSKGGGKLALGGSLVRSVRVYILGLGVGISLLMIPCHAFALWFTLRHGEAPWDLMGGNEVQSQGVNAGRVVAFVLLFMAVTILVGILLAPVSEAILEEMRPAETPAPDGPDA